MTHPKASSRAGELHVGLQASVFLLLALQVFLTHSAGTIRPAQYFVFAVMTVVLFLRRPHQPLDLEGSIRPLSLGLYAVVSFAAFLASAISAYEAVDINGIDFSIFDWMLANTNRGAFMYSPIYALNHFAVHPSWFLVVLAPLHRLCESPYFLLILGSGALWSAVIPLWKLAKQKKLQDLDAALISTAYLTTPFVGNVVSEGFRIESLFPLTIFAFLGAWQGRRRLAWLFWGTAFLSIKEDAAFYLMAFALFHLIVAKRRREAACLLVGAAAVLAFNLTLAQPYFRGMADQEADYLKFWAHWGTTKRDIVMSMLRSPLELLRVLAASGWWKLYAPLLLLPLLSPLAFFTSLPGIFLLGSAKSYPAMYTYGHYYALVLLCLALMGMIRVYKKSSRLRMKAWRLALLIFPLFHAGALKFSVPDGETRAALDSARTFLQATYGDRVVCVQTIAFPHLGYKLNLHPLDKACLARSGALALVVLGKGPYPYDQSYLQELVARADELVFASAGVRVLKP